ncbi:muconate/chloromuconate family cycloisomerase [Rhodobium gokarnense]|uniref:Muconate cycloisomerase n=1 Tax=Rhodobium gokarnense TaxID=364296 RepID=A0ABT3H7G4_9HYPH|nr:muconate/chloromuconate family cycloisomerase [Rhodobium gokarnense]MCW2306332.1 muconate cycloisomerase [Rhodobium gokarnense]
MKIAAIETVVFDLPTKHPHKLAMVTITTQSMLLVRVKGDNGLEGLGEASVVLRYGSETIEGVQAAVEHYLAPPLIGRDPANIEEILAVMDGILKDNWCAKGVIEMACVDLVARTLNVPAAVLFGGSVRESIPVLRVLGNGVAEKDIALAEEAMAAGSNNRFLVKLGRADPKDDVERALAVKAALGDRAIVHADANQCWNEATANWCIERLEAGGIALIEQPLPRSDVDGMRRLTERHTIPIMADEAIDTLESAMAFARNRAADAFSIKITKHGGLHRTKKVAAVAEAAGITMFGGTMLESTLGTFACIQFYSTIVRLDWGCQMFGPLLFKDSITVEQPEYRNFAITVPRKPGFGATIDEDKLTFYRRK